jgi:hypothetical protein
MISKWEGGRLMPEPRWEESRLGAALAKSVKSIIYDGVKRQDLEVEGYGISVYRVGLQIRIDLKPPAELLK